MCLGNRCGRSKRLGPVSLRRLTETTEGNSHEHYGWREYLVSTRSSEKLVVA